MRFNPAPAGGRGFTLVELLVAISILAVVAVIGWRGLDAIVRARLALNANSEQLRGTQLAFAQLQSDCAQIAGAGEVPGRPTLLVGEGGLTLLRSVVAEHEATRFEVVSYRFADGALTRRESPPSRELRALDQSWRAALAGSDAGPAVRLQSEVESLSVRALQDPPLGLRVELKLKGHAAGMVKVFLVGPV
ncbi:MAG TPA: type II secretory pathway component PulJ [Janthinobacterium sp.]|nr:type II secretory pathway component PulJ [Janthinobacterium sp.]